MLIIETHCDRVVGVTMKNELEEPPIVSPSPAQVADGSEGIVVATVAQPKLSLQALHKELASVLGKLVRVDEKTNRLVTRRDELFGMIAVQLADLQKENSEVIKG